MSGNFLGTDKSAKRSIWSYAHADSLWIEGTNIGLVEHMRVDVGTSFFVAQSDRISGTLLLPLLLTLQEDLENFYPYELGFLGVYN